MPAITRRLLPVLPLTLAAGPALAAVKEPFFSLDNTSTVVLIAFLVFVGILVYLKVPGKVGGMLDARARQIESELAEARSLREEAQKILASYERKQKEVAEHAEQIIAHAKKEAEMAAERAKEELQASIARRLAAAEEQIASAEAAAVKEVRDTAVNIAVAAARDVIAGAMKAKEAGELIDSAIEDVAKRLH